MNKRVVAVQQKSNNDGHSEGNTDDERYAGWKIKREGMSNVWNLHLKFVF